MPEYNVKTDRFEVAVIAMDAVSKSHLAKRKARHNPPKTDGGAESTQATGVIKMTILFLCHCFFNVYF